MHTVGLTTFGRFDLGSVKGLETVRHLGPSTIGIDTIYKSKGNIPEVFLRGCGVPEDFIVYMRSLVGKPIEFYSCFISYSSQDDDFAQRLYADLQAKHVRCWFRPKTSRLAKNSACALTKLSAFTTSCCWSFQRAPSGAPGLRRKSRQLLRKSAARITSPCFSIRLDDAVMETDQAWAADIRRTRHIGEDHNGRTTTPIKTPSPGCCAT